MKILYITTVGGTMTFFQRLIQELIEEGHSVDIATNDSERKVPKCYRKLGCHIFSLPFSRSPMTKGNMASIKQIRKIVEEYQYDIVHCHTPVAAFCTRLACRKLRGKQGVKVFYTAHGFHFYKGAPIKNWLIYYPLEMLCACYTDKLITINQEDYSRARKMMKAHEVIYVPGVGVDISKFQNVLVDKAIKRKELGIPQDAIMLLSVGELNRNKNHQLVINALAKLNNPNVHYAIAGIGDRREGILDLANNLSISKQVHMLGYRNDVAELYKVADIYILPSFREGLNVSVMEAMSSGLPVVCSRIRGNVDLIDENGGELFNPNDVMECVDAISSLINRNQLPLGKYNLDKIQNFGTENMINELKKVYGEYESNI